MRQPIILEDFGDAAILKRCIDRIINRITEAAIGKMHSHATGQC